MELAPSSGSLPLGFQAHNVIAEAQLRDTEAAATLSEARKASRERAELEKRHYEECQALAHESSRIHEEAKQKEKALRTRLQGKETALAEATADSRRYRRKYAEAQAELEATRSYAQQLLASQPIVPSVPAAEETELVPDEKRCEVDAKALAIEVGRLRAANEELEANLKARSEQAARERAVHESVLSAQAVQHEHVLSLEASLAEATAQVADTRRLLESERVASGRLKRAYAPKDMSPGSTPASPAEKSPGHVCSSASQTELSPEASPQLEVASKATTEADERTAPGKVAGCVLLSQALRSQIRRRLSRSMSSWRVAAARIAAVPEPTAPKVAQRLPSSESSHAGLVEEAALQKEEIEGATPSAHVGADHDEEARALLEAARQTAASLERKLAAADARAEAAEAELKAAHHLLEKASASVAVEASQAQVDLVQAGASAAIDALVANQMAVTAAHTSSLSLPQPPHSTVSEPISRSNSTGSFLAVAAFSASESLLLSFTFNAWKDAHLRAVITVLAKAVSAAVGPSLSPSSEAAEASSVSPMPPLMGADSASATPPTERLRGSIVDLYGSLKLQDYQLPHLRWRLSAATGASFFAEPIPVTPHHALTALAIARFYSLTIGNKSSGAQGAADHRAITNSEPSSEEHGVVDDETINDYDCDALPGTTVTSSQRYLEASVVERQRISARATAAAAQATNAASNAAAEVSQQVLAKNGAPNRLLPAVTAVSEEDLTVFMACLNERLQARGEKESANSNEMGFNVDQFKDALRCLRRNDWGPSTSPDGSCAPAEGGSAMTKGAMASSHRVLRQLEVFMKAERWRVADLFNHIDALGLGTITLSELQDGLIAWGVLIGQCAQQSMAPSQPSAHHEHQALRGPQALTPAAASAVAAAGAAAARAASAAAVARQDVEDKMRAAAATEAAAKIKRESEAVAMANMRAAREAAARVTAAQERAKRAEATAAANELFLESMQNAYEYSTENGENDNNNGSAGFVSQRAGLGGEEPLLQEEWSDPAVGYFQGAVIRDDDRPRSYGFSSRESSVPRRSSSALSSHDGSSRDRAPAVEFATEAGFNTEEASRCSAYFSYSQQSISTMGRPPLHTSTSMQQPPRALPPRMNRPSAPRLPSRSRDSSPSATHRDYGHHGVDDANEGVETLEALMGSLRTRLAEEVYLVSESLFASLECDYREVPATRSRSRHNTTTSASRNRQPTPVDTSHLKRFHSKLSASAGPLQALMLVYLRTYESLRAVLHHRAQRRLGLPSSCDDAALPAPLNHHTMSSSSSSKDPLIASGVLLGDALCPLDPFPEPPGDSLLAKRTNAILPNLKEHWHKQRRGASAPNENIEDDDNDERAFTCNDAASGKKPSAKATAALAREQAEQLTYLPGDKEGYGRVCSHAKARSGCAHCTAKAIRDTRVRSKLGFSDGGAGPSDFWSLVDGSSLEAKKNHRPGGKAGSGAMGQVPIEKLEATLWRLALLVRCQDRDKGLKLYRQESMRETLDLRFYEVLLLYLCSTLTSSGTVREAKDGVTLRFNASSNQGAPGPSLNLPKRQEPPHLVGHVSGPSRRRSEPRATSKQRHRGNGLESALSKMRL